jgi:hypothetical protein
MSSSRLNEVGTATAEGGHVRTDDGALSTALASPLAPHCTGLTPEQLLARLSLAATPLACPPSPYDPLPTGQPATCKGPPFYNSFYGAGEVDALATIR